MTAPRRRALTLDLDFAVEPGPDPGTILVMVMVDGQPFSFMSIDRCGELSDFAPCPPPWTPPRG